MRLTNADREQISNTIRNTYIPLRQLILEDTTKEAADVVANFSQYSPVLASVESIIHSFIRANPETEDVNILDALKKLRSNTLHEFSHSEDDALGYAIMYGLSRGLQMRRLSMIEVHALLDWLIHEVEGRQGGRESYCAMLKDFFAKAKKDSRRMSREVAIEGGEEQRAVIGMPFYTRADWKIQCQNSVDDSGFKAYDEMLTHTQKLAGELKNHGHAVVTVPIDALAMQEYFTKNKLQNNAQNRSEYVSEKLRSTHTS